jgi:hypothetical protein
MTRANVFVMAEERVIPLTKRLNNRLNKLETERRKLFKLNSDNIQNKDFIEQNLKQLIKISGKINEIERKSNDGFYLAAYFNGDAGIDMDLGEFFKSSDRNLFERNGKSIEEWCADIYSKLKNSGANLLKIEDFEFAENKREVSDYDYLITSNGSVSYRDEEVDWNWTRII